MDHKFTETIQSWLDTPSEQRDYAQGAVFFLQLSNNKIMYHNMLLNLPKYHEVIEYQIRKYMKFRLAALTHAQVEQMQVEANRIVAAHFSYSEKSDSEETLTPTAQVPSASPEGSGQSEFQKGKRADHDTLPLEIQSLYVENLSLLQQMRELHLQLRQLSAEGSTCPDSERFPFLKELIAKDKQYHKNWQMYDTFVVDGATPSANAEVALEEDARAKSKDAQRKINLLKGKYKKKPTPELKDQILAQYRLLLNPSEKLNEELKELGILE